MPDENPKQLQAAREGKPPLDYLEPLVNPPVARVMKHGADKYGYRNYTITPCKVRTYIGAVQRHLDALKKGEDIDPDSGESHWAHIIAGSSCYLGAELSGMGVDDRAPHATDLSDRVHIDGDQDAKGELPANARRDHAAEQPGTKREPWAPLPTHRELVKRAMSQEGEGRVTRSADYNDPMRD